MITDRRAVILVLVLTAAALSVAPSSAAQQLALRPGPSTIWAAPTSTRVDPIATAADSIQYPSSHWREGLLAGGIAGALFGALLGGGLCADSEIEQNCTAEALRGALIIGASGASLGALIGGLFPKRSRLSPDVPAGAT
jgi:hypothetical protein